MKVLFWGNFIPLQGVEYIVRAAKLLEHEPDIAFEIIGNGQTHKQIVNEVQASHVTTVSFTDRVPIEELAVRMRSAEVCLGIFGNTPKVQRVIPNKVYSAIAMAKPVITADTPAIRELFRDRENILLCRTADPQDLSDRIIELKNNSVLRKSIAKKGGELFMKSCTPQVIGAELLRNLV